MPKNHDGKIILNELHLSCFDCPNLGEDNFSGVIALLLRIIYEAQQIQLSAVYQLDKNSVRCEL